MQFTHCMLLKMRHNLDTSLYRIKILDGISILTSAFIQTEFGLTGQNVYEFQIEIKM